MRVASWVNGNKLLHSVGYASLTASFYACCMTRKGGRANSRGTLTTPVIAEPDACPTCILCIACAGCVACKPGRITLETTAKGVWKTAKGEEIWPFQMDDQHLINAINKLARDRDSFKDDWIGWTKCLEDEAILRGLDW